LIVVKIHNSPHTIAQVQSVLSPNLPANTGVVSSADRARLRKERNSAAKRARRAKLGAAPHSLSAARTEPWAVIGISPRTWYRKKKAAALRRLTKVAS
jgi:hypothetical protein